MINISNYDKVEPILYGGDFERVKLGYNECIIKNSYIQKTNSGRDALVLEIDINVGEQKDFFKKLSCIAIINLLYAQSGVVTAKGKKYFYR